jgi:hypothetical protein
MSPDAWQNSPEPFDFNERLLSRIPVSGRQFLDDSQLLEFLKTPAEEIRRFNKKVAPVSLQARLKAFRKRVVTVVADIIVVADIQSRAGVRRPA